MGELSLRITYEKLEERLKVHYQHLVEEGFKRSRAQSICDIALLRHREGHYGYCVKCKKPIDEEVLELDPTDVHCKKCNSRISNRSKNGTQISRTSVKYLITEDKPYLWFKIED